MGACVNVIVYVCALAQICTRNQKYSVEIGVAKNKFEWIAIPLSFFSLPFDSCLLGSSSALLSLFSSLSFVLSYSMLLIAHQTRFALRQIYWSFWLYVYLLQWSQCRFPVVAAPHLNSTVVWSVDCKINWTNGIERERERENYIGSIQVWIYSGYGVPHRMWKKIFSATHVFESNMMRIRLFRKSHSEFAGHT